MCAKGLECVQLSEAAMVLFRNGCYHCDFMSSGCAGRCEERKRVLMSLFADLEWMEVDGWPISVWDCVSWASVES